MNEIKNEIANKVKELATTITEGIYKDQIALFTEKLTEACNTMFEEKQKALDAREEELNKKEIELRAKGIKVMDKYIAFSTEPMKVLEDYLRKAGIIKFVPGDKIYYLKTNSEKIQCPCCKGNTTSKAIFGKKEIKVKCPACRGEGIIHLKHMEVLEDTVARCEYILEHSNGGAITANDSTNIDKVCGFNGIYWYGSLFGSREDAERKAREDEAYYNNQYLEYIK